MIKNSLIIVACLFLSISSPGDESGEAHVSPMTAGPNAFSFSSPFTDPRISENIIVDVSAEALDEDFFGNTNSMKFRLEIPFSTWASLSIDATGENWHQEVKNDGTGEAEKRSGNSLGDINVTGKFILFKETDTRPIVAIKATIKSATGSAENSRYTDSAGYEFSVLASKQAKDVLFLKRVLFFLEAGFTAWDDGTHSQNDAIKYSAAIEIPTGGRWTTMVGDYGIVGWRANGDRPNYAFVSQSYRLKDDSKIYLSTRIGTNGSAKDARAIEIGFRKGFNNPFRHD